MTWMHNIIFYFILYNKATCVEGRSKLRAPYKSLFLVQKKETLSYLINLPNSDFPPL